MSTEMSTEMSTDPLFSARKVLVLYTGGTIGMKDLGKGYEAVPHYFESSLRESDLFHDKRVSNKIGDFMLLPQTEPAIAYRIVEYDPVIDSCDISSSDYIRIAQDVSANYKQYDGFIILHGTDTLAYTASVLSFMFENLGKTVVITGAQIPIFEIRSDGRDNFLGALQIAGHFSIPEATVFFDNNLYRGNRVTKVSSTAFRAFQSPNLAPLATLGLNIEVNWPLVLKPMKLQPFQVSTTLSSNVTILRLFLRSRRQPSLPAWRRQSKASCCNPTAPAIFRYSVRMLSTSSKKLLARGVIIVNITQCQKGAVMGLYATGKMLYDIGVCPGHDMTAEAAVAKLMYVCGKSWSLERKFKAMQKCLRGELHDPTVHSDDSAMNKRLLSLLADAFNLPVDEDATTIRDEFLPALMAAAVKEANLEYLKSLGNMAGHFQVTDCLGRTPLHYAALFGSAACAELLLSSGALVNYVDSDGHTPLQIAMQRGHTDVIRKLIDTGAHLSTVNPQTIGSQLCSYAAVGDVKGIEGYLAAGVSADVADYDGRRPLHLAVRYRRLDAARLLLQAGADPRRADNFGRAPIDELASAPEHEHFAVEFGKLLRLPSVLANGGAE
uniref:asparaginase n=1 Tax=Macrostomum lignano TaxID=282301 RepID=A0A1I8IUT6_9PLAT